MNLRRLSLFLFLLFLGVLGATAAAFFENTWQQYDRLRAIGAEDQRRLDQAESKLSGQERELARLRTDPTYVERVIREQLGYARPDQLLFNFETQP